MNTFFHTARKIYFHLNTKKNLSPITPNSDLKLKSTSVCSSQAGGTRQQISSQPNKEPGGVQEGSPTPAWTFGDWNALS